MPALYNYFGMIFLFYSNEHEPVHIHVRFAEFETIYELLVDDGKLIALRKRKIKGKDFLPSSKNKQAEKLIIGMYEDILQKWFEFYVLHKEIEMLTITEKL
jgi:hypothetical protein